MLNSATLKLLAVVMLPFVLTACGGSGDSEAVLDASEDDKKIRLRT